MANYTSTIVIQARMSSTRFPGKVLAPFKGKPLIRHVLEACTKVKPAMNDVIVATSDQASDEPLKIYCQHQGYTVYQGDLNNVALRMLGAANCYHTDFIIRICADSPLMDAKTIQYMLDMHDPLSDITTNIFPRSYPKGCSVEIINKKSLEQAIAQGDFNDAHKEHVTKYFYDHAENFYINNVINPDGDQSATSCVVDTIEDYHRLQYI